jgi:hypothetical protein
MKADSWSSRWKTYSLFVTFPLYESRDGSVGTVTKLPAERPRSRGSIPDRDKLFTLLFHVHSGSEAQLVPVQRLLGTVSQKAKGLGREAGHSDPSRTEVKTDGEKWPLLEYKTPVRTSQETHYFSATEHSQLMRCKI